MSAEEAATEGDAGSSLLLNQPVVIDNGTSTLKAGFAGSSKPKVRIFEFVGVIAGSLPPPKTLNKIPRVMINS